MESTLYPVRPVKPAAAWIGGKRNSAKRLAPMIEAVPHLTYAEPFVGMGGVMFRRNARPKVEVINDWSQDVATFFRILQRHYVPFMDMLRYQLTTRAEFERLSRVDPSTLTDLERAARFLYLQRLAFGGKRTHQAFGYSRHLPARFDVTKLQPMLEDIHERISGVIIERLPFDVFIQRYDSPATLFYVDPPYWGCEDDYGPGMFSKADQVRLRDLLRTLQGRFILSLNDVSEVRALYEGMTIEPLDVTYGVTKGGHTLGRELIITG